MRDVIKAALISPLASLLVVLALFVEDVARSGFGDIPSFLIVYGMFSGGFLFWSYCLVFLVGVPVSLVLRKFHFDGVLVYLSGGGAVGGVWRLASESSDIPRQLSQTSFAVSVGTGFVVGVAYWLLIRKPAEGAR